MAKFRVDNLEPRPDAKISCRTKVYVEADDGEGGTMDVEVGHFAVELDANAVNAITGTKAERTAQYLALFSADRRIAGIVTAEEAVAKMQADVNFPQTVEL